MIDPDLPDGSARCFSSAVYFLACFRPAVRNLSLSDEKARTVAAPSSHLRFAACHLRPVVDEVLS